MKVLFLILMVWVLSAISHENDLEKQCRKYGNSKGFLSNISCNEMKEIK